MQGGHQHRTPSGDVIAIRAARLFDGVSARLVERPTVLVGGGRVVAVRGGGPEPPDGIPVDDLGDVTLLPGLIDTHVHLGFNAGIDAVDRIRADDDAALVLRMRLAAGRALAAGITTVRDLGDRGFLALALRRWFESGDEVGPHVLASGPPLTPAEGHCHFLGGVVEGEAALRRAVGDWVARGVDVVKVMATGGNMTPGNDPVTPQYEEHELRAVVEEAHALGRKVTVHAHGAAGIARGVAAGVDGIEHGGFWADDGIRADPAVIDRIAEQGIVVCPTAGFLPGGPAPPPAVVARLDDIMALVGRMHAAGVRLVAGSDAGVAPIKPHDVLPWAVRQLADAGLTNVDALAAATSAAADACDVGDRKGRLAPGKDADLVAFGGNPLVDLTALHDVRAVYRAGVRVALPAPRAGRSASA